MSGGDSRREFLRGLLGRAKQAAAYGVPDTLADAARADAARADPRADAPRGLMSDSAAPPRPLTPAELERAFAVPADQCDIADVLARLGHLTPAPDGRYVARRDAALAARTAPPLGPASTAWLDRARRGRAPDRTRPTDAAIIQAARTELANR